MKKRKQVKKNKTSKQLDKEIAHLNRLAHDRIVANDLRIERLEIDNKEAHEIVETSKEIKQNPYDFRNNNNNNLLSNNSNNNSNQNNNDDTILDEIEGQLDNNNSNPKVLMEGKNIKFKAILTDEQRNAVVILYSAYRQCIKYNIEFDGLKNLLNEYVDFSPSVDGIARKQYVEAHQLAKVQQQQMNNNNNQNTMSQMKIN